MTWWRVKRRAGEVGPFLVEEMSTPLARSNFETLRWNSDDTELTMLIEAPTLAEAALLGMTPAVVLAADGGDVGVLHIQQRDSPPNDPRFHDAHQRAVIIELSKLEAFAGLLDECANDPLMPLVGHDVLTMRAQELRSLLRA